MNSIHVNKKEFANYMGCSYKTGLNKYKLYLELAEKSENQELTIFDLANIDDVNLDIVKKRCGKI